MTEQIDDNELYTTKDVARLAGLTDDSHIRRLLIDGKLKGRKLGRQWVVSGRDLKDWLVSREQG